MEKTITDERLENIENIADKQITGIIEGVETAFEIIRELVCICAELNNRVKMLEKLCPIDERLRDQLNKG